MNKHFLLAELKVHPDRGPVTMVNLVQFRPYSMDGNGTGADAYHRYLAGAGAEAKGRILEQRTNEEILARNIKRRGEARAEGLRAAIQETFTQLSSTLGGYSKDTTSLRNTVAVATAMMMTKKEVTAATLSLFRAEMGMVLQIARLLQQRTDSD